MTAEDLVKAIEESGGKLAIAERGNRLHYCLPANAGYLLDELRRMKQEVMPVLRRRSFSHLMPFVGKLVWTPAGPGKLVRLGDYATVESGSSGKMCWHDPTAVIPFA